MLKKILSLAKKIYVSMPFSYRTKLAHRNAISKIFPKLLLLTGSHLDSIPCKASLLGCVPTKPSFSGPADFTRRIQILTSPEPQVSIIIPIYGEIDHTWQCLSSIAANSPMLPFEIIIVDDCSPDNSVEILDKVAGVNLICNVENLGFIRSCNIGANTAKGEYLYFLNNDCEVTSGWLDELFRTFSEFPKAGLVGSKLIYPDGRLQEAGCIIWQDGSAWNFGKFKDPMHPIYNYVREVDYCSGASFMVPKALFKEVGGFDELYLPAYCEDSDLALKIRDMGYRVLYQPLSAVIHYEGISCGTDTTQGTKAYQVENSKKLYNRWHARLKSHQIPGEDVDNAKDRMVKRRVLVLDHCTPTPDQDAGSVTVFNLLLLLRNMDYQVTFIPTDNFSYMPKHTTALQRLGVEVLYAPYVTSVKKHLKENGDRYDLTLLFRPVVVEVNIKYIRKHCPKSKVIYHTVDLHFLRMQREAELYADKSKMKQAAKMKRIEFNAIRAVDAAIVHSTIELELLEPELPDEKIYVFPLIMEVPGTKTDFSERNNIVFVGGYRHTPNVDAVKFFVSEIMPLLRERLPGVCFYAVGSDPPEEIQQLANDDVIVTGFVDDLNALLDTMRISVAPLRYGAGIKGKIGTAMAVGLPTVATTLAIEGMSLSEGENILVADGADAFASTIVRFYENEDAWRNLSKAGQEFADQTWGAEAAWEILANIMRDLGITTKRSSQHIKLFAPEMLNSVSPKNIQPVFVAHDRKTYEDGLNHEIFSSIEALENALITNSTEEEFSVEGFCAPCEKTLPFKVDMLSGGERIGGSWIPNWRERLVCPFCGMNNRQRLMAALITNHLGGHFGSHVYLMEQVTPIYQWVVKEFPQHQIIGSEYLGYQYQGGDLIKGIRHENVMNLSFEDNSLDLIVSNDVFEHVPDPQSAFAECYRVLKPEGMMLATIPFLEECDTSVSRAKLIDGEISHLLPPMFHGNPVSSDGSLVFTDFGWDVLEDIASTGFSKVGIEVYVSEKYGHMGGGQLVFRLVK